ncbi:hypothetical protein ERO13_D08G198700v2 [Gossypium hirsutum]|uniref:CLAVATA3/ESR-like protein n=1 Tax=Gossypium tomentosum TaxID=34277 RepID=A0A5D2JYF3_GOSTO|nr:hypothetical protein ERO13_D08G198700v2 [Gossypium hirsutum]TYH59499.1 hypothetical protein ES332_D08G225800v1 [Gossypium tomentosum]
MRIRNPKFSFLLFIIIIILSSTIAFSSCRYIHRSLSNEDEQPSKTDFFAWHFPTKSSEESKAEKSRPIHEVSYRTVPGGPNPLHN